MLSQTFSLAKQNTGWSLTDLDPFGASLDGMHRKDLGYKSISPVVKTLNLLVDPISRFTFSAL